MRQTRQRLVVWQTVRGLGGHSTADEIMTAIQKTEPGIARSTVYRALDALAGSGALHAVRLGDGPIHYEISSEEHQHAICQVCEGVLHLEHELVRELESHLEERHHFKPVRTDVLVMGICDSCARARGRRPTKRRDLGHVHY